MEYFDLNINSNISHLSKLGLEIHLNKYSSLNIKNEPKEYNDYYVSPKKNTHIYDNGYMFEIYAKINSDQFKSRENLLEIDYYDVRETYKRKEPKLLTEMNYFLNITKISNLIPGKEAELKEYFKDYCEKNDPIELKNLE